MCKAGNRGGQPTCTLVVVSFGRAVGQLLRKEDVQVMLVSCNVG